MNIIVGTIAGLLAGIAGAMGLGGGSVLMLWLSLGLGMEQMKAQGINLLFFLPTAAVALIEHSRARLVQWRAALYSAALGLLGAGVGYALASALDKRWLGKLFGALLIIMGIRELFGKKKK